MRRQARSSYALDALNICVADMRDGVGPYLTLLLVNEPGWTATQIGWALATASFTTLLLTGPAGFILDHTKNRRTVIAASSIIIALGVLAILARPSFYPLLGWQAMIGLASAFIGPGIISLSIGVSGPEQLTARIGRNETFNHGGNFVAAILSSYLAKTVSVLSVFYLVITMSVVSALTILGIQPARRNFAPLRGQPSRPQLIWDRDILLILFIVFGFQLANAAQLPLAAQLAHRRSNGDGVSLLANGIIIAQLIAIPTAWWMGHLAKTFSPTFGLRIGIVAVAVRAFIFANVTNLYILEAAQVLDGIAAGALAVAPILIVFSLSGKSSRLTSAAGVLATAVGLGASLSQVLGGFALDHFGGPACFTGLGVVAIATLLAGTLMRTSPAKA